MALRPPHLRATVAAMRVKAHANVLGYRYGDLADVDSNDPDVAAAIAGNMLVPSDDRAIEDGPADPPQNDGSDDGLNGLDHEALKPEAERRGLPTTGNATALRKRIRDHDAAQAAASGDGEGDGEGDGSDPS